MGVSPRGAAPVSSLGWVEGGIWPASRRTHTEMMLEAKASLLMWPFLLQRIIKYGSNFHYGLY